MKHEELIALLASSPEPDSGRTPFCADDHEVAAYVDGTLSADAHQAIQRHVADCGHCGGRVARLVEFRRGNAHEHQPTAAALERARQSARRGSLRTPPHWATAAAIIVGIFFAANFLLDNVEPGMDGSPIRALAPSESPLQILSPEPGAAIPVDELLIRWDPVETSLHYELRIVTADGGLVFEQRIDQPEWRPTAEIHLEPDTEYFVRVDALMPDARSISSRHVLFKVAERP